VIYAVTQESAHLYGDAMPSMYRLRYRAFVERQSYDVFSIRKMEYDAYDTPAAVYLVWRDAADTVRGCTRLTPSDRPYMIRDLWPDLVASDDLPRAGDVWEASRFCIDKDLTPELRAAVNRELVAALQEFGLRSGTRYLVGVMQPRIWKRVFTDAGWPIDYLGPPKAIGDREEIAAGRMPIAANILNEIRRRCRVPSPVICNFEKTMLREAA
jgi:N-acyl-L-homoserine lactone synthetase